MNNTIEGMSRSEARELDLRHEERLEREREARLAAGMGFWRLVWIVALGILIAQGIAGVALFLFKAFAS